MKISRQLRNTNGHSDLYLLKMHIEWVLVLKLHEVAGLLSKSCLNSTFSLENCDYFINYLITIINCMFSFFFLKSMFWRCTNWMAWRKKALPKRGFCVLYEFTKNENARQKKNKQFRKKRRIKNCCEYRTRVRGTERARERIFKRKTKRGVFQSLRTTRPVPLH